MSGVATAIVGGAVVGSLITANAAGKAADTQANSAKNASELQWNEYQQNRQDQMPWLETGKWGLEQYKNLLSQGFNYDKYSDPGTQFQLQMGSDALSRATANKGGMLSGSNLSALQSYGQQVGNTAYQNAYNRYQANLGSYGSLAGLGQNTAATLGSQGSATANNMGNYMTQGANAQAAGIVGQANAINGGLTNAANMYNQYNMLSNLGLGSSGGYSSGVGMTGGMQSWYEDPANASTLAQAYPGFLG